MSTEKPVILPNNPQWATGARAIMDWILDYAPNLQILEFGSGGSSLYMANKGASVTSVEHHPDWAAALADVAPDNLKLIQHQLPYDHLADQFDDAQFDVVIIDGRGRVDCAFAAEAKLKPGGLLIFDDTHRPKYQSYVQTVRHWACAAFQQSIEETLLAQKPFDAGTAAPAYAHELAEKLSDGERNLRSFPAFSQHIKTFGFEGGFDKLRVSANQNNAADEILANAGHLGFVVESVQPTLVELKTGHVVWHGEHKQVLDCFHKVVSHTGIDRENIRINEQTQFSLRHAKFRYQRGTMVDLTARGSALFSFWLLDVMPRVHLVREIYGPNFVPDHVLINKAMPFAREGLELLGWGGANIIESVGAPQTGENNDLKVFGAETLIVPGRIREKRYTPRWAVDFLRDIIVPTASETAARVYLSRNAAKGRNIENEEELVEMLAHEFGFEVKVAENLGLQGAAKAFAHTKHLLSPHGAGLANMLFMPAGGSIYELFSNHYTSQYRLQALSCEMGYEAVYAPMPGESLRHGKDPLTPEINRKNLLVDVPALKEFLARKLG